MQDDDEAAPMAREDMVPDPSQEEADRIKRGEAKDDDNGKTRKKTLAADKPESYRTKSEA